MVDSISTTKVLATFLAAFKDLAQTKFFIKFSHV
jgi:hypothetical protein